jgi:hypothetical protein
MFARRAASRELSLSLAARSQIKAAQLSRSGCQGVDYDNFDRRFQGAVYDKKEKLRSELLPYFARLCRPLAGQGSSVV